MNAYLLLGLLDNYKEKEKQRLIGKVKKERDHE